MITPTPLRHSVILVLIFMATTMWHNTDTYHTPIKFDTLYLDNRPFYFCCQRLFVIWSLFSFTSMFYSALAKGICYVELLITFVIVVAYIWLFIFLTVQQLNLHIRILFFYHTTSKWRIIAKPQSTEIFLTKHQRKNMFMHT